MKYTLAALFLLLQVSAFAQDPDHTYKASVHSVKLYRAGDIYSYPVMTLNSGDQLELHFDDFDGDVKNYYYSFELCNADWTPCNLQRFDYIRGFQSNRISTYRSASISQTRYTHYQVQFPDRSMTPTRSGNYLLKVFINDHESDLVFTRRFLVVENKIGVSATVTEPYNAQRYKTWQRLQIGVNTANSQVRAFSPQDFKVVMLQNNVWSSAIKTDRPDIFRGSYYEYSSDEGTSFPAGKEWRWIDLRSLQLMSDRMQRIVDTGKRIDVFVKPEGERKQQVYIYYTDLNGIYTVENRDGNNPYWQSDYAYTHFTFVPPGNQPYPGKDVFVFGELTGYATDAASKMDFNTEKGVYEKTLLLKQGYYNYNYVTKPAGAPAADGYSMENTEGNYFGTENSYTVLVYYRAFGARADELIGYTRVSSVFQR